MSAPEHIWEDVESRFDAKNFTFKVINFYRLAAMYSIKAANPNFLQLPYSRIQNPNA